MVTAQGPVAARAAAGMGSDSSIDLDDFAQARLHLATLHKPGTLIELRVKTEHGMAQRFFSEPRLASEWAVSQGKHTDVYVGVLPRLFRQGGKSALPAQANVVWAEADNEPAAGRVLNSLAPLIIRSSSRKLHAYWFLSELMNLEHIEQANKRLAYHLGADPKATDAARILRVAGTRNHKRGEPTRVAITRFNDEALNVTARSLIGGLHDPEVARPLPAPAARNRATDLDGLRATPARQYIPALTGREVRHGLCTCPFHKEGQERTPSLSVGGPNEELWLCFGCDEGGDIFTFAAKLWGMDERTDFPTLKTKLKESLR